MPDLHGDATVLGATPELETQDGNPSPAPGRVIGAVDIPGYEIQAELGRGGMGVVYKARQAALGRSVALKVVLAGVHASPQDLQRFQIEARAVARLQHPNIVQVFDIGSHQNLPYLSLEFCDGQSLAHRLDGTPWPASNAAQLVETLARAIHTAHEQSIVHRDLKPANVLLTSQGIPKITDFGLAKQLDAGQGQTETGTIMGTPSYMAPEQADGRKEISAAADIYALGAILYELLTGRPPFRAATPLDTVLQVINVEPVAPSRLQPSTPRDIETICLKCLAKDPRKRYATAVDLAEDLARFLDHRPILARPIGPIEVAQKWVLRRPLLSGLLSVLVLVAVVSFVLVTWKWREADWSLAQARVGLYANSLADAERVWRDTDASAAREILEHCPVDLRGWEWNYLQRLMQGERSALDLDDAAPVPDGDAAGIAFSFDGRFLWIACSNGLVRIRDLKQDRWVNSVPRQPTAVTSIALAPDATFAAWTQGNGSVSLQRVHAGTANARSGAQVLSGHTGSTLCAAVSPDSLRLATGGQDGTVRLWATPSKALERTLVGPQHFVTSVAFSADSQWLAAGSADNRVYLWTLSNLDQPPRVLHGHSSEVRSIAFHPDSQTLASASWDKSVVFWDPRAGRRIATHIGHTQGVYHVAFSPDGLLFATASGDRTAKVWDARTRELRLVIPGHSYFVTSLAFSPDSRQLVVGRNTPRLKIWSMAVTTPVRLDLPDGEREGRIAFSPDGSQLVYSGRGSFAFDVLTGVRKTAPPDRVGRSPGPSSALEPLSRELHSRVLAAHGGGAVSWVISPDRKRVASAGADRRIKIWNADTNSETLTLTGHTAPLRQVVFSRDGHWLASLDSSPVIRLWDARPLNPSPGRVVENNAPSADRP